MNNRIQHWKKLGLIYDGLGVPGRTHATLPVLLQQNIDTIVVVFSARDQQNRSLPFRLQFDMRKLEIECIDHSPLLDLGEIGTFDDSGIMPSCAINKNDELWLYYIGWNLGVTVPFRNSIGLAKSTDGGRTFNRMYKGPIVDRNHIEPHFAASCCVLKEKDKLKMWYLNCVKWEPTKSGIKHYYHIKYAASPDGINWQRNGIVALDFEHPNEYAISSPFVVKENGQYKMWYSYRGNGDIEHYRIGYAESEDGISWNRLDSNIEFQKSDTKWDIVMNCYPCVFNWNGDRYMLYNGNEYGKSGIGLAVLEKSRQ